MTALALRPVTITDAILISTDAVEAVAAWDSGTSYATGERVRSDTTHRVYESAIDSNLAVDPTDAANQPTSWIDVRPANDWAMFDAIKSTRTTRADSLEVVLQPGQIDCLGLARITGATVQVVVNDGTSDVYDVTIGLVSLEGITDWYSWFFQERIQEDALFLRDLPAVPDPTVTITITGASAAVGACQVGRQLDIGSTELGASLGFKDYSSYADDGFGAVEVVDRGYSLWEEVRLFLPNNRLKYVRNELLRYRSIPIFFALDESLTALQAFGFPKRLDVEIPYHNYSLVSLRVEETLE